MASTGITARLRGSQQGVLVSLFILLYANNDKIMKEVQTQTTGLSRRSCTLLLWVEVVFVALWIFLGTRPTNAGIAPDSINTMRMQLSLLISGMGLPCTFNVTHEQPLTSDWGRLRRTLSYLPPPLLFLIFVYFFSLHDFFL
jgi:hypothetical protein